MSRPAIFVTGAAAGIGRATVQRFVAAGWFAGIYDVDTEGLASLGRELGEGNTLSGRLDVTDYAAVQAALQQFVQASGGRLDLLFNCAGILAADHFEDIPIARHQRIVDINLKGVINGCHAALPHLKRTPGARVINMASASAIHGAPDYASYSATKFAVKGLSEALDIEWQRHDIRVMDLLPLFVRTAMVTDIRAPGSLQRLGVHLTAEDIATVVWRAAHWNAWRRVHWYPGWQSWLTALGQKLSPAWLNRWITKTIAKY